MQVDYFTQLLIQRDPAVVGQVLLREKLLSQTNEFAKHYGKLLLPNEEAVCLREITMDGLRAALCSKNSFVLLWSGPGIGWVEDSSHPIEQTLDGFQQHIRAETLQTKVVVVCHRYGAAETARKISDAGVKAVVWVTQDLMGRDGRTLLFDVLNPVMRLILDGQPEHTCSRLLEKNWKDSKLNDRVGRGVKMLAPLVRSDTGGLTGSAQRAVTNVMAVKVPSNMRCDCLKALAFLSSDDLSIFKRRSSTLIKHDASLELAVCDLHEPAGLVSKMQAEWTSGETSKVFKVHLFGSEATDASRCRAVALEAVTGCVVDEKCDILWRVQTCEDAKLLGQVLQASEADWSKILVWVDLVEESEGTLVDELKSLLEPGKLCRENSIAVLLLTSGGSDALREAAKDWSDQFDAEHEIKKVDDASAGVKAHPLHANLRLHLTREQGLRSPFELLDERGFAQLVSEVLPYNSRGGGSEERSDQARVPIAGMYVDKTDLIVAFCVSDVAFLKRLNHDVLSLGLGAKLEASLKTAMASPEAGVVHVEADLTEFAENFERTILALDKLTMHQTEKLKEVLTRDHVHLYAPVYPTPSTPHPQP